MTPVARGFAKHRKVDRRHPVVRIAEDGQARMVVAGRCQRQAAAIDGSRGQQQLACGDRFGGPGVEVAAFQGDAILPGQEALCEPAGEVREIGARLEFFDGVSRPVNAPAGVAPKIHIGLRVGLPVAQILRKHGEQALPQVDARCFVALFLRLVAAQEGFRVGIERQRRLDHAMVQIGDQRGERIVGSTADSGLPAALA